LAAHGLLYQPDYHHHDAAADTAGNDLTDDRADVQAARSSHGGSLSAATHQRAYDLRSHSAADDADNRVADGSEVILLQCRAGKADLFPGRQLGTILGVITIGSGVGSAAGAWTAGWIFDVSGSYRLAFILSIIAYICGCIAFWALRRPPTR